MVAFIDAHRRVHGVESICALLPIAPSTYFRRKAEQRDPTKRSARAQRDGVLQAIIRRIWNENQRVFGLRKVWKQMGREQLHAARCRLRRLMRATGDRCDTDTGDLVHHSDRGTQYLSIRYTERLADAGIELSVGSRGDAYDNALAETVIGLFKTEVIRRRGPWRSLEAVEFATLEWVDWFNHRRLLEPIGYVPPAEYEASYKKAALA
jgi:transposase InsO family protein